jgi:uncharacterized protein
LDEYLRSDNSPPDCLQLSDLDGFLTAVAIGPEFILPSEWLPHVWGQEQPAFTDAGEAQAVLGAIMGRYEEILRQVDEGTFVPILWTGPDDTPIAADWAEGFLMALTLRREAWSPLFNDEDHMLWMFPILALYSDGNGDSMLGLDAEAEKQVFDEAPTLLPGCVAQIAAFWRARRPADEGSRRADQ